jgi:hypothetical protein
VRWRTDGGADSGQPRRMNESAPKDPAKDTPRARARQLALSQWEDEGGAGPPSTAAEPVRPSDAEGDQLRMRVIALENLVIALLAEAGDPQRTLACDMGNFISPRPGYTPHPLTLRAAEAMRSLLDRAERFRSTPEG